MITLNKKLSTVQLIITMAVMAGRWWVLSNMLPIMASLQEVNILTDKSSKCANSLDGINSKYQAIQMLQDVMT